jgi:hypothetical protein
MKESMDGWMDEIMKTKPIKKVTHMTLREENTHKEGLGQYTNNSCRQITYRRKNVKSKLKTGVGKQS